MPDIDVTFRVREATAADILLLACHRAAMFPDMGKLAADCEEELIRATADYLREALPRGEYLGWVAQRASSAEPIGGAGVQLGSILPRPGSGERIELGPEAIILNVYVNPEWRRRGVGEALMRAVLAALAERQIRRIVLHASAQGRRLYERLGFVATRKCGSRRRVRKERAGHMEESVRLLSSVGPKRAQSAYPREYAGTDDGRRARHWRTAV